MFIKDRQSVRETLDWDRLQTLLVILSFKHIPSLTLLQFSHLKLIAKNENKKLQITFLRRVGGPVFLLPRSSRGMPSAS